MNPARGSRGVRSGDDLDDHWRSLGKIAMFTLSAAWAVAFIIFMINFISHVPCSPLDNWAHC